MPGSTQGGRGFPYVTPLQSCLMPESFTGTSDFEDYLQQFNTAALLSGWHSNTHDDRPHYFALRLKEKALHFYTTLSFEQETNFDLFTEAFGQNYTTNGDILKARLKAAKQQHKQDIAAFLCDVRTLARRAFSRNDRPNGLDHVCRRTQRQNPAVGTAQSETPNSGRRLNCRNGAQRVLRNRKRKLRRNTKC